MFLWTIQWCHKQWISTTLHLRTAKNWKYVFHRVDDINPANLRVFKIVFCIRLRGEKILGDLFFYSLKCSPFFTVWKQLTLAFSVMAGFYWGPGTNTSGWWLHVFHLLLCHSDSNPWTRHLPKNRHICRCRCCCSHPEFQSLPHHCYNCEDCWLGWQTFWMEVVISWVSVKNLWEI